jgi:signal recognition particle GTPase
MVSRKEAIAWVARCCGIPLKEARKAFNRAHRELETCGSGSPVGVVYVAVMNVTKERLVSHFIKSGVPMATAQDLVEQVMATAMEATPFRSGDDLRDTVTASLAAVAGELERLRGPQAVN